MSKKVQTQEKINSICFKPKETNGIISAAQFLILTNENDEDNANKKLKRIPAIQILDGSKTEELFQAKREVIRRSNSVLPDLHGDFLERKSQNILGSPAR